MDARLELIKPRRLQGFGCRERHSEAARLALDFFERNMQLCIDASRIGIDLTQLAHHVIVI